MQRAFSSAEFLRSVNPVPYDHETDQEAIRRQEYEASYVFARNQERIESVAICRAILGGVVFSVVFGVGLYAAWCLL